MRLAREPQRVYFRAAERAGERHVDAVGARGRPARQRVGAESDQREHRAAEHDRDGRPLAPPPAQRLGQPPGLVLHDHRDLALLLRGLAGPGIAALGLLAWRGVARAPAGMNDSAAELMQ